MARQAQHFTGTAPATKPVDPQHYSSTPTNVDGLDRLEQKVVGDALEAAGWNVSKAARSLKMSRDQVRYRIDKFDLRPHPDVERSETSGAQPARSATI